MPETKQNSEKTESLKSTVAKDENAVVVVPEEVTPPSYDLTKFQLERVLHNNTVRKSIALLGKFPDISTNDTAIVLFEKQAFRESDVQTNGKAAQEDGNGLKAGEVGSHKGQLPSYFSNALKVQTEFVNNIYGSFQCVPSAELNSVKTTVVYPATEKHIEKYSITQRFLISETPYLYENLTLPYITSSQFSLDWVYNILEHRQEVERIVFEDSDPELGFILLPDLKWDGKNVETLYLLGIIHKHGIKSLRDLTAEHLPLLRNMRQRAAEAVEQRYGLTASQLRMYFHYQPSFYHLHVHINLVRSDAPGIWCEKSHMLDTVINNLELLPDYYKRATLPFVLYAGSKLLEQYEESLRPRKRAKCIATAEMEQEMREEAEREKNAQQQQKVESA